ncbi:MAG: hypothetical protein J7577_00910 [Sphingobacteriaceae bacterium]|nr:hypothetical protein [Sphingobacteriaceae bacterium]
MVMTADEKTRFQNMEGQLNEIGDKVDEILGALKGDSMGTSTGLIADFKDLKIRVRKMEDFKNKMIWVAMGAGLAAGFTMDKVGDIITKILK